MVRIHNENVNRKAIQSFKAKVLKRLAKQDAMRAIRLNQGKIDPARFAATV